VLLEAVHGRHRFRIVDLTGFSGLRVEVLG
jgi:hypothetical protein